MKATHEGVIRLPVEATCQFASGGEIALRLTLVVCDDLNFAVLHDTDAGVRRSQIDADDGAGDAVVVLGDGLLVLSVDGLCQHQAADKDHEKVKSDRPCRALAGAPRASRHCVCVVWSLYKTGGASNGKNKCGRNSLGVRSVVDGVTSTPGIVKEK